jgi:hypothetical protein
MDLSEQKEAATAFLRALDKLDPATLGACPKNSQLVM